MIITLPQTSTREIAAQLVSVREDGGAVMLGRVLTLVVLTDEILGSEKAIAAANAASREHPCRVIVVIRGDRAAETSIDAEIRVGGDAGASEVIVLRLGGELSNQAAAVITPLLLPDTPVVAWWPRRAPAKPATDKVGRLAIRRITDADGEGHPSDALRSRLQGYSDGDTDLAWARLTYWRGLLASVLDGLPEEKIRQVIISGPENAASVDLGGGWLASRLGVDIQRTTSEHAFVRLERETGTVQLRQINQHSAILSVTGRPDTQLVLARRRVSDCLAEELRQVTADKVYYRALQGLSHIVNVSNSTR